MRLLLIPHDHLVKDDSSSALRNKLHLPVLQQNININIYIYIYRKSASRFSRGTVLNTLKQSRINIMRGKMDATTFPDKPVSRIASLLLIILLLLINYIY